jgi:hypothetical protein
MKGLTMYRLISTLILIHARISIYFAVLSGIYGFITRSL